jgi:hypothetical protein
MRNNGNRDAAIINLYNLNAHGWRDGGRNYFIDAWEVILKDFKINQSKDRPFVYNYSIDFTGIRLLGTSKITERTDPGLKADTPKKLNLLQKILNAIEKWYGLSESVKNAIQDARSAVNRFTGEVERYLALITGSFDNYMQAASDAVSIVSDVYNSFKRITMAPADSALRIVESLKTLREKVEEDINDIKTLPDQWGERYGAVENAVQSPMGDYKRYFEDTMQDTENISNDLYARSISRSNPIIISNIINQFVIGYDKEEGNAEYQTVTPNIVVSYGFLTHITNSLTSLENLAEVYLGDPDQAQTIALINGITGDDEIHPGDQIKIPILTPNNLNTSNMIFGLANIRDTLGIDIAIENGIIQVGPNGDFMVKTGYGNMNQALNSRISESIGNRLRLNAYGIRNVAGAPDSVVSAYLYTSIKDTVLQDPRVERIDELYFKGSGDNLLVQFSYYTYDGILYQYKGEI